MISKLRVLVVVLLAVLATATEDDGRWSLWTPWSRCNRPCAGGVQRRVRICNNPPPKYGGKNCEGNALETQSCNRAPCPVDGRWSLWTPWSRCNRPCAGGVQQKVRICNNPPPKYGGKNCEGNALKTQFCNRAPCPDKRRSVNTRGAIGGSIGAVVFCVIAAIAWCKKRTGGGHN